jgi:ABC-2 type transport system permease protein
MLNIRIIVVFSHQATCLMLCFGLAGIAVGLGARYPHLRETSPSRIAAGFGGTLCLVISTLFIIVMVLCTALPTHYYLIQLGNPMQNALAESDALENINYLKGWIALGWCAMLILGVLATWIPMRVGFKHFCRMET